jgi:hypothetical protein
MSFRSFWVGAFLLLLLFGWFLWLILARVPLYLVSTEAELLSEKQVVAYFPPSALVQIQPGQSAQVRLDDFPANQYGTLQAQVTLIDSTIQDGHVRVELQLEPLPTVTIPVQEGLTGVVEVLIAYVSPATFVFTALVQPLTP